MLAHWGKVNRIAHTSGAPGATARGEVPGAAAGMPDTAAGIPETAAGTPGTVAGTDTGAATGTPGGPPIAPGTASFSTLKPQIYKLNKTISTQSQFSWPLF